MMIPEPWENHEEMDRARRAFYQFHSTVMEPWDGPACVAFTDGTLIGAVLDRNGLRPSRYWVTHDGLVILASEVGVLDIDPANVVRKGRLQPGRIFLADTASRRILEDGDVKAALAAEHPYQDWLHAGLLHLDDLPDRERELPGAGGAHHLAAAGRVHRGGTAACCSAPMARAGAEPIGSMGTDTPIAVLSDRPRLIFDYFTQLFAQVTNPPLDAIREELVTSLSCATGPEGNLLEPGPASCRQIVLPYPVMSDSDLAKIIHINDDGDLPGFAAHVVDGRFRVAGGGAALRERLADDLRRGVGRDRGRRPVHRAVRPRAVRPGRLGPQPGPDPVAAAHRRRPPPPDPGADPDQGGPGGGVRRRPRGPPHRAAHRVRRGRGQPLPRAGVRAGHGAARRTGEPVRAQGRRQPDQGAGQGPAQDHVQDGGVHGRLLHRRADLRGDRPGRRGHRHLLHRDHVPARAGSGSTCSPQRRPAVTPARSRPAARRPPTCGWTPAASTSGGARASRTCSAPRPCSSCSTRPAPAGTRSSRSTPGWSTTPPRG